MHFDRMPKRISKQFQLFEERGASLLEDGKGKPNIIKSGVVDICRRIQFQIP